MWRHYVYIHLRLDTNTVFYVGKGTLRSRCKFQIFERASAIHKNKHWLNIVNITGYRVIIVASCQTDNEAQRLEKEIIAFYGKQNLANLTDGGDGHCGLEISNELRRKRSEAASKPRSENWISSIRAARKNGGNGGVVERGDKLPESWRANIAAAKVGDKNPQFGKVTKIARKVVDKTTGKLYESVSSAANDYDLNMKSLYNMLSGHRKNSTTLRFADDM